MSDGAIESNSKVNGGFAGAFCGHTKINYNSVAMVKEDETPKKQIPGYSPNFNGMSAWNGYA